jgi:hypothetical protein
MFKVRAREQLCRAAAPVFCRTFATKPPNILVVSTCRWPLAARLAIRFAQTGCRVEVLCPRGHLASKTSAVVRTHLYHPLAPLGSFRRAIQRGEHDLVVPCDDLAAAHLHDLYEADIRSNGPSGAIAGLLERSLGAPKAIASMTKRSRLMDMARFEGIVVPETAPVRTFSGLQDSLDRIGFPAVLKADGTAAGIGVRIVRTRQEAERAFRELGAPPAFMRLLKRAVVDHDQTLILPFLLRKQAQVNVQNLIAGRDATASIACWEGQVLASITFEVLRAPRATGPASVVRVLEHPQIADASVKLVRRLNLSGLYGLDFKIDDSNVAHLLEMNPRATQSSHLSLGKDRDLVGALVGAISGQKIETETATAGSVIALFPNEWQNNPASEFLRIGYHDVPWSEPELVRGCMKKPSLLENWCSSDGRAGIQSKIGWPGAPDSASSASRVQSAGILAGSDVPAFGSPVDPGGKPRKWMAR